MKIKALVFDLFILVGFFIILYNPPVLTFNSMHLVGFVSIFILMIQRETFESLINIRENKNLISGLFLLLIYLVGIYIFINHTLSVVVLPLYYLLDIIPFMFVVLSSHSFRERGQYYYFEFIIHVGLVQVFFALLTFFSPSIKMILAQLFLRYGYGEVVNSLVKVRFFGVAAGLTYATPVFQGILSIISLYLGLTYKRKYLLFVPLFVFSAIINARISIIVIFIGGFLLVTMSKLSIKSKVRLSLIIGMLILIIALFLPFLTTLSPSTFIWIESGMDEILQFIGGKAVGYFSYIVDKNIYEIPRGLNLIWGTGKFVMASSEGFSSDIGYINDLWFGGIVYMLFLYGTFYLVLYRLYRSDNQLVSFTGLFLIVLYPILNIKGYAIWMNEFTNFAIIIFLFDVNNNKHMCKNGQNWFDELTI